ncbi:hypothetical protein SAMN05661012_04942 [Chitinophaga sancti]|uniref:Uncharacterized protein n=1 Tax=Chitinophaga sancti TaxID=1004 RepID=A0A1K1S7G5_9BACT|nr:hypothetical protein SAMN05661012_04942 [Chitinophaga sancti]
MLQTTINSDPVYPGAYLGIIAEAFQVLPYFNKYLLNCIVGGLFLSLEIPFAHPEYLGLMLFVDGGKLFFFTHVISGFRLF